MKKYDAERLPMPDADVYLFPQAFSATESEHFLAALQQHINWKQDKIKMFGKELELPRLTAWYGEPGTAYSYSGIRNEPLPFTPELLQIKTRTEALTGQRFNSVLLNFYRHGTDSMGWHSDDEAALGKEPVIASVSFGATRTFQFRHKTRKELPLLKIPLTSGSLLLMTGATQQYWKHQLPKTSRPVGPRLNLTFRQINS